MLLSQRWLVLGGLLSLGVCLGGCPAVVMPVAGVISAVGAVGEFPECHIPPEEDEWAAQVLDLVNQERTSRGLNALQANAGLAREADIEACEMIHYDYFDHVNPVTGTTPMDRFAASGFKGLIFGENLAAGVPTPAEVVTGWMNSPDHRDNILDPEFTHLGVGVRLGGEYRIYWVQLFGGV